MDRVNKGKVMEMYTCPNCGTHNVIVNQCGCDSNNLPTTVPKKPYPYRKGDRVRDIYTGKVYTVKLDGYWQFYAGGDTSDYTVELESIDPSQPAPWNKSSDLEPVPCCGAHDALVEALKEIALGVGAIAGHDPLEHRKWLLSNKNIRLAANAIDHMQCTAESALAKATGGGSC